MSLAIAPRPDRAPRHAPPSLAPATGAPVAVLGVVGCTLALRHAGTRTLCIRYSWLGDTARPVRLVAGGISAGRHLAASDAQPQPGWWQAQVGAGLALDPARHGLLAIDWIGVDGTLDAPIDPADQADAIAAVLDALGIAALDAFIGCSYGAMVGLQFAARHPSRVRRLVAISGTHRAHPYASALRALQRRAVALGALQCDARDGLALARQLAMLGYRTPEEFAQRFGPAEVRGNGVRVGAEDYLDHCGAKYIAQASPTAFVRLSESIDLQAVAPEEIAIPVTVVAVAEDRLVPIGDAFDLVERLARGRGWRQPQLRVLRSVYGHDAFLKEHAAIGAVLREALA